MKHRLARCIGGGMVVWKQHSQGLVELRLGLKQLPSGGASSRSPLPGPGAGWSLATALLTTLWLGPTTGRVGWQGGWGCWYKTDLVSVALSSYIPSTFTFSGDKMSTESYTYLCWIVHAWTIQYPTPWLCPVVARAECLTRGRYYLPWLNHNAFDWKAPYHCECTSAVGRSANDQL